MTIPAASAPQYSDLYSQSNTQLVEAQAVSFRQTYEGTRHKPSSNDAGGVPTLVTIPSSNVMLDHSEPPVVYQQTSTTTPTTTSPIYHCAGSSSSYPVQQQHQHQRYFHGRPVKAKNAHLPDSVLAFKEARKGRTVASAWAGGVIGLFTFGPVGAAVGALSAYGIAKGVGKSREKKLIAQTGTLPVRVATTAVPNAECPVVAGRSLPRVV